MRSKTILGLVLLNALLLAGLFFHKSWISSADAQVAAKMPAPSEYLMTTGEVSGGTSGLVFIIDTRNNLLSARTFNGKTMDDMPPIDLSRIFK